MQDVQFKNRQIDMAGNLYLPADAKDRDRRAAIVCVHPGGGVKEQAAGLYARRLAEKGFVTLAFDSTYQGASGGAPRFLDEPMNRVDDVWAAVDYLTTVPQADPGRIGVLGVCAGGGVAVKAACIDRRIHAVATVSAVDVGAATRRGWDGKGATAELTATLEGLARQRTAEAAGAAPAYVPYVPKLGDHTAPRDLQDAADYYLTPRGQHPNAQNKMLMSGLGAWAAFEAFDLVDTLLTQPLLVVAGAEAGSFWHSQELHAKARGPKDLVVLQGAGHIDLYDKPQFVTPAVDRLGRFFAESLGATPATSPGMAAE